jgi:hypothetical protein
MTLQAVQNAQANIQTNANKPPHKDKITRWALAILPVSGGVSVQYGIETIPGSLHYDCNSNYNMGRINKNVNETFRA